MNTSKLYKNIQSKLLIHDDFYVANADDEGVHHLLATTPMKVGDSMEIIYDRSRDLLGSFEEGGLRPNFVLSHDKKFLGVLSDVEIYEKGIKKEYHYSSDLRVDQACKAKTRIKFRNCYRDIVADLSGKMFTCILDENKRAINALTKGKHFFYHKRFSYTAYTTLMTPLMRMLKSYSYSFKVLGQEEAYNFFKSHNKDIDLIVFHKSKNFFGVFENDKLVGILSADRSQYKKLIAHPLDTFSRSCLFVSKSIFKQSYEREMPWVYLTNCILLNSDSKGKVIESFIKFLYVQKELKSGELFQFISGRSESAPEKVFPMVRTEGTVYEVSVNEDPGEEFDNIFLNPLML